MVKAAASESGESSLSAKSPTWAGLWPGGGSRIASRSRCPVQCFTASAILLTPAAWSGTDTSFPAEASAVMSQRLGTATMAISGMLSRPARPVRASVFPWRFLGETAL
ncbi:hypothetical protein CK936_30960 [Streptomyces albireticuli]|uniref:Uncharacterized protein n=1 Tax=Streptomyces albireticuli TaxID=1940 RepID=A0A2A2D0Y9_9ACTN|nr:hypothetical protein CK936_30960 [Streptomyces albireticuli]